MDNLLYSVDSEMRGLSCLEAFLFKDKCAYWVKALDLSGGSLTITIHPCLRPEIITVVRFEDCEISSVDSSYADECCFPWDIISFDAYEAGDGCWRFCMHTDVIEYAFLSKWPVAREIS